MNTKKNLTKKCGTCKKTFPKTHEFFHKRGNSFKSSCKKCRNLDKQKYRLKNLDKIKEYADRTREQRKKYKREWERKTRKTNITYKLISNIRVRIGHIVRGSTKSASTLKLLGCDLESFKQYIEQKFLDGMSWENYGQWHIDHIRPCAAFNLKLKKEQKLCFHYTNLQPLWAKDNLRKGAKYVTF